MRNIFADWSNLKFHSIITFIGMILYMAIYIIAYQTGSKESVELNIFTIILLTAVFTIHISKYVIGVRSSNNRDNLMWNVQMILWNYFIMFSISVLTTSILFVKYYFLFRLLIAIV